MSTYRFPFFSIPYHRKVHVGKDQEKAQSEKDSHSKNCDGKKTKLTINFILLILARHLFYVLAQRFYIMVIFALFLWLLSACCIITFSFHSNRVNASKMLICSYFSLFHSQRL